jgi:hypothetical protein
MYVEFLEMVLYPRANPLLNIIIRTSLFVVRNWNAQGTNVTGVYDGEILDVGTAILHLNSFSQLARTTVRILTTRGLHFNLRSTRVLASDQIEH